MVRSCAADLARPSRRAGASDNPFGITVSIIGALVPAVSSLITVGTRLLAA
jgi:hypothetical protein